MVRVKYILALKTVDKEGQKLSSLDPDEITTPIQPETVAPVVTVGGRAYR